MALIDAALTTVNNVQEELGITSGDLYLERLINSVSERIASYCGRTFYYETAISEAIAGYGLTTLSVSRTPIVSITSISLDGSAISSDDYEIWDANAGLIFGANGFYNTSSMWTGASPERLAGTEDKDYTVVYVGGYVTPNQVDEDATLTRTLPYDLEDACIVEVASRYRNKGRDRSVASEKMGSAAVSYHAKGGDSSGFLSPETKSTLGRYKRIRIA